MAEDCAVDRWAGGMEMHDGPRFGLGGAPSRVRFLRLLAERRHQGACQCGRRRRSGGVIRPSSLDPSSVLRREDCCLLRSSEGPAGSIPGRHTPESWQRSFSSGEIKRNPCRRGPGTASPRSSQGPAPGMWEMAGLLVVRLARSDCRIHALVVSIRSRTADRPPRRCPSRRVPATGGLRSSTISLGFRSGEPWNHALLRANPVRARMTAWRGPNPSTPCPPAAVEDRPARQCQDRHLQVG